MRPFRGILCMTTIVGATLLVALAGHGWGRGAPPGQPAEVVAAPAAERGPHASVVMIGSRTCASTACHGSVRPDPRSRGLTSEFIRRDEYVHWSDQDPHARSLLTLENQRSQQIFAKLRIKNAQGKVVDPRAYDNCRACHATKLTDPATQVVSYESVSCEACHGPAQQWRETHYQRTWNEQQATRSGFVNTKNLAARAQQCIQCHVGAADREVNHDLIAAGHPVLKFELAAYHEMLPKHWNDSRERARTTDFELHLWAAGQQHTAEAALALTHARLARLSVAGAAERSPVKPVWPELAEYDCFACHHDMAENKWYPAQAASGLPAWNPWNLSVMAGRQLPQLDALRALMPQQLRTSDADLLAKVSNAQVEVAQAHAGDSPADVMVTPTNWDSAVQAYLQLAAQFRARQDAAQRANQLWAAEPAIKQQLLRLRKLLAFEESHDSPSATDSARHGETLRLLQQLQEQLAPGGPH